MATSEIRFGIVGTGMIAHYHAEAIAQTPGARLVAVCRARGSDTAQAEAEFGVPCMKSLDALLARDDIDAICICTPSGLHAEQTIAAARAGKHVLVEKPMAISLPEADAMIAACHTAGVRLGVALQSRTDPRFQSIHAAIKSGELGRLVLGTISIPYVRPQSYYDSAAWRGTWALDGGGALMNQGIHIVDLLVWFMGDAIEVNAHAATLSHSIEVEDCIVASLRFANGALGTAVATTDAAPGYPHRIEIYGERGGIQVEGSTIVRADVPSLAAQALGSPPAKPIDAGAGAKPSGISTEGHIRLLGDMVAAIREGRDPLTSGEEGRRSLALIRAIYEAAAIGS